jgi:starch synthase (maltosyl-transferring)
VNEPLSGFDGRRRIVIENVRPQVDCGRFPIRRVIGETVTVQADVFADGHEETAAALLVRAPSQDSWREVPMTPLQNDRWEGSFTVEELGAHVYTVEGWLEPFVTWQRDLRKRLEAGQEVTVELIIGAELLKGAIAEATNGGAAKPGTTGGGTADGGASTPGVAEAGTEESGAPETYVSEGDLHRLEALARSLENPVEPGAAPPDALSPDIAAIVRRCGAIGPGNRSPVSGPGAAGPRVGDHAPAAGRWNLSTGGRSLAYRYEKELEVRVERPRALFGAWYELFPRSTSGVPGRHGTLADAARLLPDIADLGFQVIYLPPIHPIGRTNRKGRNNATVAEAGDPGSPWAIGATEGGHKAVHPELGTLADFDEFRKACSDHGLELAVDIAFQCSPDHPYVKEHPEWFRWRPDGSVQYAENPPKKYEDILPINFETDNWQELWEELGSVFAFWIDRGVRIFRVDNPHTKPFAFWEWVIAEIKRDHPEVIFLAEAFTRPKIMYRLAKLGFTQSYTYFTWRHSKRELMGYLNELTAGEAREYCIPSFWPNTPDILPEHLQFGGRAAFVARLVLAATLSSSYGIYGPAFELCVARGLPNREEYADSEKYELKAWEREREGNVRDAVRRINGIRRDNPALHTPWNLRFLEIDNENLLAYLKTTEDLSNTLVVVVNLDPYQSQGGRLYLPLEELGISERRPFLADELLQGSRQIWHGPSRFVTVDPAASPACVFRLQRRLHREQDFDYYL